jgi:uncharacterized protein (TIGR00255 family)
MVKSMTGYGSGKSSREEFELGVEIKTVNNRFADVSVRLPRGFLFAEEKVKAAIQAGVSRGKADVFVSYTAAEGSDVAVSVNLPLAKQYYDAVQKIGDRLAISEEVSAYQIVRLSEVVTLDKPEPDKEKILECLLEAVGAALLELNMMRMAEGARLASDIVGRLETIESRVKIIEERSPETVKEYRERLYAKLSEVLENTQIDESRILTEAAIYADKVAVDEETVRLRSHIAQMRDTLSLAVPVGRKLDFIVQEMNREANTIGSKCSDSALLTQVLEIKAEVEKLREQVQNIE